MYFCNVKPAIMDFKQRYISLFLDIKYLILEPKKFWHHRKPDTLPANAVTQVFLPLVVPVGLAVFLGEVINRPEILWSFAVFKGIREMVSYSLQLLVAVPVLAVLLKNFGGTPNRKTVTVVLVYTLVPFLLVSLITGIFHALYIVSIAGLYGFYLFALGALDILEIPTENQSRYVILAILLMILIFGLVNILCWRLFHAFFPYGA